MEKTTENNASAGGEDLKNLSWPLRAQLNAREPATGEPAPDQIIELRRLLAKSFAAHIAKLTQKERDSFDRFLGNFPVDDIDPDSGRKTEEIPWHYLQVLSGELNSTFSVDVGPYREVFKWLCRQSIRGVLRR
jgi:hypothetical protein